MSLKTFGDKLKESFFSVFPFTLAIFLLVFTLVPTSTEQIILLAIGSVFLILGTAIFSLGADSSMIELGNGVGATLSKKNKLFFMLAVGVVIGFVITFAEPDLMVLAKQVAEQSSLSSVWLFIAVVSLGVGILMTLGILRIYFKIKLSVLLLISYGAVLILSFFAPQQFVPIAFDSGSVTTGPISVPFLISFGLGLSAVRRSEKDDDSFGLIALCSVGPILSVMFLSLFLKSATPDATSTVASTISVGEEVFSSLAKSFKDVAIVLLPIIAIFVIFQIFSFHYSKQKVVKMLLGFFFVYLGIVIFLAGVECGYLPMGTLIGKALSGKWYALLVLFVLGALAIIAEPALHVLKKQVEDVTNGAINQHTIMITISLGVALSVVVAGLRAIHDFNILYVLIPMYALAVVLGFVNTKLFTAIAFDSGGVATGALAVSFILPMITGLSSTGNGFGTVGLIACFPIVTLQILGLIYKIKLIRANKEISCPVPRQDYVVEFDD